MKKNFSWMIAFSMAFMFLICGTARAQKTRSEEIHFQNTKSPDRRSFLLYKPKDYDPKKSYPLIVYLHGSGSVGSDLSSVRKEGLANLLENGLDIPFIVVCPQLPPMMNNNWAPDYVDAFVQYALTKYRVNADQLCMTGFSMGGSGVWEYACKYPAKVASAIPMSGWGNPQIVCAMKAIPTWAFHGNPDPIVNIKGSRNLVTALKNCGGAVQLTELTDGGHDIWAKAYSYPNLFPWILSKKKNDTTKIKRTIKINDQTISYKLPKPLASITGLAYLRKGEFFAFSGSGSKPVLITFDTTGHIGRLVRMNNASNLAWQDVGFDNLNNFYIADIGNSTFKRKHFQIYKIKRFDILHDEETVDPEKIEFVMPEGLALNLRSIFWSADELYCFGQAADGSTHLLKVPDHSGLPAPAIEISIPSSLSALSFSSSYYDVKANSMLMLGRDKIWIYGISGSPLTFSDKPTSIISLHSESNKEALTKLPSGEFVYADQHFLGTTDGNFYVIRR